LSLVFSSHTTNDYILRQIFIGAEEHNNGNIIMIITTMEMEMKWHRSILLSRTVASDKYRPFDSSRNRKFYLPERKMAISSDFQPLSSHSHFWHKMLLLYAKITWVPSRGGKITTYSYYSYGLCARRKRSNKILFYNLLSFSSNWTCQYTFWFILKPLRNNTSTGILKVFTMLIFFTKH